MRSFSPILIVALACAASLASGVRKVIKRRKAKEGTIGLYTQGALLPCDGAEITVTGKRPEWNGLFKPSGESLKGVPYFLAVDGKTYLFFDSAKGKWTFIGNIQWQQVLNGFHFNTPGYGRDELGTCGAHDAAGIIAGWDKDNVTCDTVIAKRYTNVQCFDTEYSAVAQRYCPKACAEEKAADEQLKNDPSSVMPACRQLTIKAQGPFKDGLYEQSEEKFGHVPVYKSLDQEMIMYYRPDQACWKLIGKELWQLIKGGSYTDADCFSKDDAEHVQCGVHDADMIPSYGIGCEHVRNGTFTNVDCQPVSVQRYCAATCTELGFF